MLLSQLAKSIRLLILDVDGVLTDGGLFFTEAGESLKRFHAHDGLGIKALLRVGIQVAVISGRESKMVEKRMEDLGITHVIQGNTEKLLPYEKLLKKLKLKDHEVAYIGDDIVDLPVLRRVGFKMAPVNAIDKIKQKVDWVIPLSGGHGAVRMAGDFILESQGLFNQAYAAYIDA